MSESAVNSCGCCAGLDAETPLRIDNPAGLAAVAYRIGTHARFKQSLLARLSGAARPALAGLRSRDDADFTIALCDGLATVLDVLAFYQERIANENYLRTAGERLSIQELARLIGYQLAPGVAASTWLAFSLQDVPGSPALAAGPVTIPVGTRVQSVPGQGGAPQVFETSEAVEASADWNAIPVQAGEPWHPARGDRSLWLAGTGLGLQGGDVILIVGQERLDDPGSERWDARLLTAVHEDKRLQRTRVDWGRGLGHGAPHMDPAATGVAVFVFRQRAMLFGHNAPDPRLMGTSGGSELEDLVDGSDAARKWKNFSIQGSTIDLDAAYPKILPGGWIVLVSNGTGADASGLAGYVELYRAGKVSFPSRLDFGLSGKVTRIVPDTSENLDEFRHRLREVTVFAQEEELAVAAAPLSYPLFGDTLALSRPVPALTCGRALAVSGRRARIRLRRGQPPVPLDLDDGGSVTVIEGDSLRLAGSPEIQDGGGWRAMTPPQFGQRIAQAAGGNMRLTVLDRDGRQGRLMVPAAAIELMAADSSDPEVQEIALVDDLPTAVMHDRDRSTFCLASALRHCYDRDTARVNANVAPASHGETAAEILGSGDPRQANQRFSLRQSPLTYVSAATPNGRAATLELRVNDLLWKEVPSLHGQPATARVFALAVDAGGHASVQFGDGSEGARLPSGDHNVRANYRKGLGLDGNIDAGTLTTLLSRPLGVSAATNPQPATGGEDPEGEDKARSNAPLTVLTLERVVSIRDYRDFARAFAGIAKAHACWQGSGSARGVLLTVAGENGAAIEAGGATFDHLLAALHRYGDPRMPVRIVSYRDARFRLHLTVRTGADAEPAVVLAAVQAALRTAFGFPARDFGQPVSVDEVAAVAHGVTGVEAVQVLELHRVDAPLPVFQPRIFAALPVIDAAGTPLAAELLALDDAPIVLETMP